jgi:uncharacterized RDD family membrane protein YckC
MNPSEPFDRALSRPSTLPSAMRGLDADPLWAALLTSVQNVVLSEIRAARYPALADESARPEWPALLDQLRADAHVRIGREIVDELTVDTVDELWATWMRRAGSPTPAAATGFAGSAEPDARAVASLDPGVQDRIIELLDLLGEVVDTQLATRFGIGLDGLRSEVPWVAEPAVEAPSVGAPGIVAPVPTAIADAGVVVAVPPALAGHGPAAPLPVFDWEPDGARVAAAPGAMPAAAPGAATHPAQPPLAHPVAVPLTEPQAPSFTPPAPEVPAVPDMPAVPPAAPGWRPLAPSSPARTPAPLGRRAAAHLIDRAIGILIAVAASLLFVWPAATYASSSPSSPQGGVLLALAFVGVGAVSVGWFFVLAWLVGRRGASPGKRLMRLEVTGFSSPGPIGFGRAILRELTLGAFAAGSILTVWLPYVSVFWDPSKRLRGWHDRVADDIVVEAARL